MKIYILSIIILSLLICPSIGKTNDKVIVVPLLTTKNIPNIVTVAKSGGDFTDPINAVESIKDASSEKPYVVVVSPGFYSLNRTLVMKDNVSIVGLNRVNTTLICSVGSDSISQNAAAITSANDVELSGLSVYVSSYGEEYGIGIYNNSNDITIKDVHVGGAGNHVIGIYNYGQFKQIFDVTIGIKGDISSTGVYNKYFNGLSFNNIRINVASADTYGLYNEDGYLRMSDIEIYSTASSASYAIKNVNTRGYLRNFSTFSDGNSLSYGVYNESSNIDFFYFKSVTSGLGDNFGFYNSGTSTPSINDSTIETPDFYASPTTKNYGLYNTNTAAPNIYRTTVTGATNSVFSVSTNSVKIFSSSIIGGFGGSGVVNCLNSNNGFDKELTNDCAEM